MTLRVLTLTQPWCGLMAAGVKLVENRSRPTIKPDHIGHQLALHASREYDDGVAMALQQEWLIDLATIPHANTRSAILCVATLAAIVRTEAELHAYYCGIGREDLAVKQRQWKMRGSIGYVLRDIQVLAEPVSCRGWQGFWTADESLERQVMQQLVRAA